jgi:hypothetical protein
MRNALDLIPPMLVFAGSAAGMLLGALLAWQLLVGIGRLIGGGQSGTTVSLLLTRLAAATRAGREWNAVLLGLRLELPWPWPWRLSRAVRRLAGGEPPDEVLAGSDLLPGPLRAQAAQALRQGPAAFAAWCDSIADQAVASPLAVRQQAFLITEGLALAGLFWFLATYIFPKFTMIILDLGLRPPPMLLIADALAGWWIEVVGAAILAGAALWGVVSAWRWRRRRRLAAARLILAGCAARLPEAAMAGAGDFAACCAAAGWAAADPAALARQVARAETREAVRAAWLPALLAALAPLLAAVPVGLVVVGIMHMLVSIIAGLEPPP